MAKTVIIIEDNDKGELEIKFTADKPLPDNFNDYTLSQILVSQLYEVCNVLLKDEV